MLIDRITLTGRSVISLPIYGAKPSDRFIIKDVDGLGPPDTGLRIGKTVKAGGKFQGRAPALRQIIATVSLKPRYDLGETVDTLRTELYGLIALENDSPVRVTLFKATDQVAVTYGHISKFEPALFDKDPVVVMTIDCLSSYWSSPGEISASGLSLATPTINNPGTAPGGFEFEIQFTANIPGEDPAVGTPFTISNYAGEKMSFIADFLTGDRLYVQTVQGGKEVKRIRSGTPVDLIYSLSDDSTWLRLYGGQNRFFTNSIKYQWNYFTYFAQYWGV